MGTETRKMCKASLILCNRTDLEYRDFLERFIRRTTGSATKKSHLVRSDISWISLTFLRKHGWHFQGSAKRPKKCRKIQKLQSHSYSISDFSKDSTSFLDEFGPT